jgi:hypothetical protein
VTGDWRKMLNEELHNLYCDLGEQVKKNEMGGSRGTHGTQERCI